MIDLKLIRDEPERVKKAAADKRMDVDVDQVLAVDARRRELETEFNNLRHEQKQAGEQIAKAPKEEKAELSAAMGKLKSRLKELETQRQEIDAQLQQLMLLMPQIPHADAPVGADESGNVVVRHEGTPRKRDEFGFEFRDHLEIGAALKLFDMERGVKLAGSRNYCLVGAGAMLHEAVLRLAWDMMINRGFTPLTVPVLVTERLMEGTGFFPLHRDEVYLVERDEKALVGTSEVPVTGLHADELLNDDELPKKYIARSTCFRREAGAAGRDTRGLYRIHYFDKLEEVIICKADAAESEQWHNLLLLNAEDLLQALELPYRVIEVCTGDMGQSKYRQYDIETWMPSRDGWGETHSASQFHDFQARRLNIRYRDERGKPQVCYTLNSTVAASPRLLIPLLENHQQADGSIYIPPALRPHMGGLKRIG